MKKFVSSVSVGIAIFITGYGATVNADDIKKPQSGSNGAELIGKMENVNIKMPPIWKNHRFISEKSGEMTPFTYKERQYRIENVMYHAIAGKEVEYNFHEDHFRIRDMENGRILSHPLVNHYFATAIVHDDMVYAFSANYGYDSPWWTCKTIDFIKSSDLVSWSAPIPVIHADKNESLFNSSIVYDGQRFVMLYESNDPQYVTFTFKFAVSKDLEHWEKLPDALYGAEKYVGGPTMMFSNGYYYITYVNCVNKPTPNGYPCYYDTRIARSKDLINWQDAPEDRPVLVPDFTHEVDPVGHPGVFERNASDAEFFEKDGKVTVYWNGGNQLGVADCQSAEFDGTLEELFGYFFPANE